MNITCGTKKFWVSLEMYMTNRSCFSASFNSEIKAKFIAAISLGVMNVWPETFRSIVIQILASTTFFQNGWCMKSRHLHSKSSRKMKSLGFSGFRNISIRINSCGFYSQIRRTVIEPEFTHLWLIIKVNPEFFSICE